VSVKEDELECKRDYFKSQILPKIVFSLIPIIGEYFIYTSDLTDCEKLSVNIPIVIYYGLYAIISTITHQSYYFTSIDKVILQRLKRIKKNLDNNINLLDEVDEKDFECYINNINDHYN